MGPLNIFSGIYTDTSSDFRVAYPRNLWPVALKNGISLGYLRPAEGLVQLGTGPGTDRGGINWDGICYRVMGTSFGSVDEAGAFTTISDVGSGGQCSFTYSFDYLAINSGTRLYLYNGTTVTQVTDSDLGDVVDVTWGYGHFITTDATSIVVTELNDPFSVNPLKYGSSEADPDAIQGLLNLRNELYAINRYTIEVFQYIGGSGFPFQRVDGALIPRGAAGTQAKAIFLDSVAFLGGGRNEPAAVWLGSNGSCINISTREIEQTLLGYPESDLASAVLESRITSSEKLLYVHLPDRTLVYSGTASALLQEPIWFTLDSGVETPSQYRARNFVWCYDKWIVGDPTTTFIGQPVLTISSHYGDAVNWEFSIPIIYNNGDGALFMEMELICLTGRVQLGDDPVIWTSYTLDGLTWSQEKSRRVGLIGDTLRRIIWFRQGFMRMWRAQRFRGSSDAHLTVSSLKIRSEPLNG